MKKYVAMILIGILLGFITFISLKSLKLKESRIGKYQMSTIGKNNEDIIILNTETGEAKKFSVYVYESGKVNF